MTRKQRKLTNDEQSLWNRIAQKIKPLFKNKKPPPQKTSSTVHKPTTLAKRRHPLSNMPTEPSKLPSKSIVTRRINTPRKVVLQGRLDLHGLTLREAQAHLNSFIMSCQIRGYIWVLVITGKGRHKRKSENTHTLHSSKTLQELVPEWLDDPCYNASVAAYAVAKPQEGGSGALYVRLKKLA